MNGTEGKLARHARARQSKQSKQTLLRQKEHFARARAGLLQNQSKQAPPAFSPFPSCAEVPATDPHSLHHTTTSHNILEGSKKRHLLSSPGDHGPAGQPHAHYLSERAKEPCSSSPLYSGWVDDSAVLAKRRKLLRETDWAGVRMQKQIPVHFEESQPSNNRWTRRRRSSTSRAQHLASNRRQHLRKINESTGRHHKNYKNQNVRITIGSQEIRLDEGSSIHQSSHAPVHVEARPRFRGAAMPSTFVASSTNFEQPSQMPDIGGRAHFQGDSHLAPLAEPCMSLHAEDDSGELLRLEAPRPIRHLPELNSSFEALVRETDCSIVAQVGRAVSPVPASKQKDNEVWRGFAEPSETDIDRQNSISAGTLMHRRISPGVSRRYPEQQRSSSVMSFEGRSNSAEPYPPKGHQGTQSHGLDQQQNYPCQVAAFSSGPGALRSPTNAPSDDPGTATFQAYQSASDHVFGRSGHSKCDVYQKRQSLEDLQSRGDDAGCGLSSGTAEIHRPYAGLCAPFDPGDTSESNGSETDSIDRRVASLRKAALKLVSRRNERPFGREGKEVTERSPGILQWSRLNSDSSSHRQQHEGGGSLDGHDSTSPQAPAAGKGDGIGLGIDVEASVYGDDSVDLVRAWTPSEEPLGQSSQTDGSSRQGSPGQDQLRNALPIPEPPKTASPKDRPPSKDPDDIWFKYVFSDTNTEGLHKEVLDEATKESSRNHQRQAHGNDPDGLAESEQGYNISISATCGQTSIGPTESGVDEEPTSSSGLCASHKPAIGSPVSMTQTAGTTLSEWKGRGGPPYAAPSTQASTSAVIYSPALRDSNDSGAHGPMVGETTDVASSLQSKAVEAPRSLANSILMKESFRFAPPKLFVGKLSELAPSERPVTAIKPVTLAKPKRGGPKKKARDGRANIRSIPVFGGDPIEEYDELDESQAGKQGRVDPSLFGPLDTE